MGDVGARETLKYKLKGSTEDVGAWGNEYVRHLSGEVGAEWQAREEASEEKEGQDDKSMGDAPTTRNSDLLSIVRVVVPYNLSHSAEHDAVDLLLDISRLELLLDDSITKGVLTPNSLLAAAAATTTTTTTTTTTEVPSKAAAGGVRVDESEGELLQAPHARVSSYLCKCATYAAEESEVFSCLITAFSLYMLWSNLPSALLTALRLGGEERERRVKSAWEAAAGNSGMQRQLAIILGRARVNFETGDYAMDGIVGNVGLSSSFAVLARDLDVMEPKGPEDVYKSHLSGESRAGEELVGAKMTSALKNLADTYVSAFVNVGFGSDKLVTPEGSKWPYENKDHGKTAAVASIGFCHLWNDSQMPTLDKYLHSAEDSIKCGGLLGLGVMFAGTRNPDADAAFALLSEVLEEQQQPHTTTTSTTTTTSSATANAAVSGAQRAHALLALGLAYAGSNRSDVADLALPFLGETAAGATSNVDVTAMAAVCIGLTFCGCGAEKAEPYGTLIAERLLAVSPTEAGVPIMRHLALGLGLLFLGRGEEAELFVEQILPSMGDTPLGLFSRYCVHACAYAGTGNAVAIQRLLRVCAEHPEMEEKEREREAAEAVAVGGEAAAGGAGGGGPASGSNPTTTTTTTAAAAASKDNKSNSSSSSIKYLHQSLAVLGLGLVSAGEDLSIDMAGRMADHLLQYGDASVRRAVPLALGVVHLSDPAYSIVDILSKLSHDHNEECAQAAVLGLGLVGAGTNNSRIAGLLRTLSVFYKSSPETLFITRLAQGLLHMGKVRMLYQQRSTRAHTRAVSPLECALTSTHTHTHTHNTPGLGDLVPFSQ